jgi:polyvinyl alcohol dehydrogenase (cytochrome)
MRRIRSVGTGLAVLLAAASAAAPSPAAAAAPCNAKVDGGNWPVYGHDLANTRTQPVAQGLGPGKVAGMKPAWVFSSLTDANDVNAFQTTPVVDGGCVFIGATSNQGATTYALDAATGKVVWTRKLDVPHPGLGGGLVGAAVLYGHSVIYIVNNETAPYVIALDRSTGAVVWRSAALVTKQGTPIQGYYTNASPIVANGLVVAGYSPPEGDPTASGGFVLLDAATGAIVKDTPTIPPADQAKGYAGGGLWSTPAYDPKTKYMYWGVGNPSSKQQEHPYTNAIVKIDLDRSHPTFGEVVASYKGNVDQYTNELETLSHTPVCAATDNPSVPYPFDDPACGQLDLDFGASANLFTASNGTELVGDLQKSGVYHAARADTMAPAWSALVGVSCNGCNGSSAAFDGSSIDVIGTPGGAAYSLARDDGSTNWTAPVADGTHFQSVSTADGVVWTVDSLGFLDAYDASDGSVLAHRPMSADAQGAVVNRSSSSGVAIAEHKVFVASGDTFTPGGYVIAYEAGN